LFNAETVWIARAQCGDRDALEQLLRSVQAPLYRFVHRIVGPELAEDVLQDVLITIARKLNWLSEPRLFRAWAFRVASRAAFRQLKKETRHGPHETDDAVLDAIPAPSKPLPEDQLNALLDDATLSPASRAVLILHFAHDMTLEDVAAVLELPLGTVKSRLAYGLKALRRHFNPDQDS
jgi:RNA polymerase sigma-70 factor (ECF subfamily)